MILLRWMAVAMLMVPEATGTSFASGINAQGLLGSHFGIPALAGSFDYVVVGGGTGGLTVARRLAKDFSVAVIEAGDFFAFSNGNLSEVPAYATYFTGNDPVIKNANLDWYMYTEPQAQLGGKTLLYDSGKGIGGSSGRNFLWQIRGTEGCFQKWADEVGDPSFTFPNLLPYFKKSYSFTPPDNSARPANASINYIDADWDTQGGPMSVSYQSWANSISSWLELSLAELGVHPISGFYNGTLLGSSSLATALQPDTQTRSSAADFLSDALLNTPNLITFKSTLAKRIVFDGTTAVAVEVDSGGILYNITASREVIVSAGVMRSPQMLMVSGIGPAEVLEAAGVPVLLDRPGVGQNFWDNVLVGPTFEVDTLTHSALGESSYLAQAVEEYNNNRTGMLTNVGGDFAAFEKVTEEMVSETTYSSLNSTFPADWPNLEFLILDAYFGSGNETSNTTAVEGRQYVASSVGLVSTFSRGNVSISSPDTSDNPVISPNWLLDPRDQELAVAAFKRGRDLFNTSAIAPVVIEEVYPGAQYQTDEDILQVVLDSANSVYNGAGTNKMGKVDDPMAVVDSTGRVIGAQGLRVVDASIFPFLPPGQPSATVYMLAEKIADGILNAASN